MSKLLYVEDELRPGDILNYFDKFLSYEEKEILDSRKVKTPKDIKALLDKNPCIHVEYNFIDAINTIDSSFDDFSFFIIDRDLYASEQLRGIKTNYKVVDVPKLIDTEVVPTWEGDYLFLLLLDKYWKYSNPRLLLENFYFLTAHSAKKKSLKIEDPLGKLFLFFPPNHVIEKDITDMVGDFVENKINKFEDLVIKSEHREVFEIFSKGYLDKRFENQLLSILRDVNSKDPSKILKNVSLLRQIFEVGILNKIVITLRKIVDLEKTKEQIPNDYDKKNKYKTYIIELLSNKVGGNLEPIKILKFLNGTTEKKYPYGPLTERYFSYSNFLFGDSYYRIISDKIWKVSSEIAHGGKPTHYTLPILVNILMDFFIWFGDFMDKNK